MPKTFETIVQGAKKERDQNAQINFVLAAVADKVRYMGDWRAIDGAFVPRSLQLIGETHFGDCKDLATLTVKILRILGFESEVAWVFRGKNPPAMTDFGFFNFNHAIVSVVLKNRQLWLDPTNFQSFAQGVFEDIAERKALVISDKKIEFRSIEFPPASESQEIAYEVTSINSKQVQHTQVKVEDTGMFALALTGSELKDSKEQFEKAYIDQYANVSDLIKFHFEFFELKSRIVRPIEFHFSFDTHFHPTETSLGTALDFSPPQIIRDIINVDRSNRESDLQFEVPSEATNVYTFSKMKGRGRGLKNCHIRSTWLDYDFEVSAKLDEVTRRVAIKKYIVKAEEVKSKAFESFQSEVRDCGLSKYLVLDRPIERVLK